jgi:hypothetical protein
VSNREGQAKQQGRPMIRRLFYAAIGTFILIFVGSNISNGVIWYRGVGTSRAARPVAFWVEAIALVFFGILLICCAIISDNDGNIWSGGRLKKLLKRKPEKR